jgi:hypothetical protein
LKRTSRPRPNPTPFFRPPAHPTVQRVMNWPGQDTQRGEEKVLTLIWYEMSHTPLIFASLSPPIGRTQMDVLEHLAPKPFQLPSRIKPRTSNGNLPSTSSSISTLWPCTRLITSSSNHSLEGSRSTRPIPTSSVIEYEWCITQKNGPKLAVLGT